MMLFNKKISLSALLSVLLHPLFLPVLFELILLKSAYIINTMLRPEAFNAIMLTLLIFTVALPILIFTLAKYFKVIESFEMKSRHERIFGISITGLVAWFSWKILSGYQLPDFYSEIFLIILAGALLALAVTWFFKVSLHVFGWSLVFFSHISYLIQYGEPDIWLLPLWMVVIGWVAWARLKEKAHRYSEILLGFCMGSLGLCWMIL